MMLLTLALRELRGGLRDFRMFLACLIIGVAVIAAVGSVSRHIEGGISKEAKTLLGGDIELSLTNARATPEQLAFMQRWGRVSLSVTLRAMATAGENTALVELKGVDENYPLLGTPVLRSQAPLQERLAGGIVAEEAFVQRLQIAPGDSVTLGTAVLKMQDVLTKEPDSIASPLSLGPRVMARLSTLDALGFLQPAGLIRYQYHVLLRDSDQVTAFRQALAATFPKAPWIVKTTDDSNRNLHSFIERLQLFMTLAGLSALLIGGIGIMNATDMYITRKSEDIAILKTLGASQRTVFQLYTLVIGLIALAGSVAGALLGSVLAVAALPLVADFLPVFDTQYRLSIPTLLSAILYGLLIVATFATASLGRAAAIRPALLFRGATPARQLPSFRVLAGNIVCAGSLIAALLVSASDRMIALGFIGSAIACFIIFALLSHVVQAAAKRVHLRRPWARQALANLYRPGAHTLSILLSTGIGLTVLIALLMVEGNFQQEVKDTLPKAAPSLFLIDIQPEQQRAYLDFLSSKPYVSDIVAQPMIRGRLSKLNAVPVENIKVKADAKWAVDSDRGLSYAATPPPGTRLVKGAWWAKDYRGKTLVSMDRKLAGGLGLDVGDTITVNVLGEEIEAEIASLREINYISFQINFAMIFSPGVIETLPSTFLATVRIDTPEHETQLIRESAKQFSNISSIRIRDSIAQIAELVGHIAVALRLCALVTLVTGVLVLASALAATLDARTYDMVVLKVLGARRGDILAMFLTEWLLLAAITAVAACVLGAAGAWLILLRLDWISFSVIPGAIASAAGLSLGCIVLTGLAIHARIFRIKPASILRNE